MKKGYAPTRGPVTNVMLLAVLFGIVSLSAIGLARLINTPNTPAPNIVTTYVTPTAPVVAAHLTETSPATLIQPTATNVPVVASAPSHTATQLPSPSSTSPAAPQSAALLPDVAPNSPSGADPAPTSPLAIVPTAPPLDKAAPKPAPTRTPDPNLLPNGVRYGDHKPDLPDRIVRIASPNIKLDTTVYEVYIDRKSNTWQVADYAAGHNYNSANPGEGGNIVLAGHNNWRGEVFRYLEFLKLGDTIQVWTLEGKEYDYRVTDIQKLQEAGASMAQRLKNATVMNPTSHEQLTLITCWPYTTYTHRLIVTALPAK